VFEQLRDLRDRHGFEVAVILNGKEGALVERFKSAGITVHAADFDFTSNADLLALPRKVLQLVRLLNREKFDVIHTHLFHSMVIGRIAAWFADVPVRLSMIAGPFHLEAYTPRWIDRYTLRLDTAIIASCEFTRSLYLDMHVPRARLALVYYGPDENKFDPRSAAPVDLRGEFGWEPNTPLIGLIAYFYPELPANRWIPKAVQGRSVKRQEDLIRAAPTILKEFPKAKIVFIGSGWEQGGKEYLARMQALVEELGLGDSVVFTGYRTDVAAVLRSLDVAVQCSVSENLGGTIESLLMECPTVATRVGGMVDSVIDGETGVLVHPAAPESLAEGILRLLRDPETARRYGRAGREHMLTNLTLRHTVDQLAALYRDKLKAAPAGYRPLAIPFRFVSGALLCTVVVLRYCLLDAYLLPRWDQGWRPWRANALSVLPLRTLLYRFYALVGRHAPSPGIRQRLQNSFLGLPPRMLLYRFYAFVGRHAPSFGIRRRIKKWLWRS
jgi:glycosyltransferase involved in cell wall biosynthesis